MSEKTIKIEGTVKDIQHLSLFMLISSELSDGSQVSLEVDKSEFIKTLLTLIKDREMEPPSPSSLTLKQIQAMPLNTCLVFTCRDTGKRSVYYTHRVYSRSVSLKRFKSGRVVRLDKDFQESWDVHRSNEL